MIEVKRGDILDAQAEALVNTVNCVGIMGRGIALQFRKAFPDNFKKYELTCKKGEVQPGKMLVYETGLLTGPRYIINFPTKRHWKGKSRIEHIQSGLDALIGEVKDRGIRSVAIPPLGCGLGGLKWSRVKPLIETAFRRLPAVEVLLYEPAGAPSPERMVRSRAVPKMTPGRAVLIELIRRYLAALLDSFVSLLEIHKLMYFMQEAGETLNLRFQKGTYGPYSTNLRHVLSELEGHYLTGYGDADDKPGRSIELLEGATERAETFLSAHAATQDRFKRVVNLIQGFETPHGMELLATVHWVATREGAADLEEVLRLTYEWNERKKLFDARQVKLAWNVLSEQKWI